MDRKLELQLKHLGDGSTLDPIKPKKCNTLISKIGNLCAYFDKLIKKNPEGFSIDKKFLMDYLNRVNFSHYVHKCFHHYGYRIRKLIKKPYVNVTVFEND